MEVKEICAQSKMAANTFSGCTQKVKNDILIALKDMLLSKEAEILEANFIDVSKAIEDGKNKAFVDRLTLNKERILSMVEGLEAIISLKDPVGEIVEDYLLENGLNVKKVRAPLGVVGIVFEARPNVAIDAAALCIKSGNGVVLRGSKDSINSVEFLVGLIKKSLEINGISESLVGNIDSSNRDTTIEMLKQDKFIDVIIPRGGEALKKVVSENATMPYIASSGGNCHIYVAKSADIEVARNIIINAKTSRPAVCNAVETILFDSAVSKKAINSICESLEALGVEIRVSSKAKKLFTRGLQIDNLEMYKEYDDLIVKIEIVSGIDEAISHINKYSTHHSEAIISSDNNEIEKFMKEVDSCALYVNASTRFTDGFQLGLGAEMGISTQKLHVRGPIGLKELTSIKYCVYGKGQIRK